MTPLQQHAQKWTGCKLCALCEGRKHVVIGRGRAPAELLFCGEAPGSSEDVLAQPFVGPAGSLLDQIIERSVPADVRYALNNLVGCYPLEQKKTGDHAPPSEAIKACASRLREFVELCQPRLIVCVGNLARDWLDLKRKPHVDLGQYNETPRVAITHPAAILRANAAMQPIMIQRCIVTVRNAVNEYLEK